MNCVDTEEEVWCGELQEFSFPPPGWTSIITSEGLNEAGPTPPSVGCRPVLLSCRGGPPERRSVHHEYITVKVKAKVLICHLEHSVNIFIVGYIIMLKLDKIPIYIHNLYEIVKYHRQHQPALFKPSVYL